MRERRARVSVAEFDRRRLTFDVDADASVRADATRALENIDVCSRGRARGAVDASRWTEERTLASRASRALASSGRGRRVD